MKIIDRYLLRQFLWNFVVCFLSMTGLVVVFDAFTNLEAFLATAGSPADLLKLMGSHYGFQGLLFFDQSAGLLALVATMFTVSWIQRHNEMTALMSAGISRLRVVAPVIAAAIVINLFAAANRELVVPRYRAELTRKPNDLVGDVGQKLAPLPDYETDILLRGKATYAADQRIEQPEFLLPGSLGGHLLVAENALYLPPEAERPGGYLLDEVKKPEGLVAEPSLRLEGRPVIVTPPDAPGWLKPNQCFVVSGVSFEQLTGGDSWQKLSSTAELVAGLRNRSLDFGAGVRVTIHSRFVQPLLDTTLVFLGLPLVLRREQRNVFVAIGMAALLVAGFMLVVMAMRYLGTISSISPSLAAWAPLMIFVPLAVGMSDAMRQ